jgi:hypothetical protein
MDVKLNNCNRMLKYRIRIDLREIGWDGMDWIDLAQDRDQWRAPCEHGNEPSGSIKCWEILE